MYVKRTVNVVMQIALIHILQPNLRKMNRTVTEVEKRMLKQRLVGLKLQLSGDSQTHVLQPELIHGLTDEVITDIVVKSEIHCTPDDVMTNCQIWSYETGVAICNIIT